MGRAVQLEGSWLAQLAPQFEQPYMADLRSFLLANEDLLQPGLADTLDGDYHQSRWDQSGVVEADCLICHLEGYRFDPASGKTVWAINKEETGKNAYRVKMQRNQMETDLIMFACRPTTFFSLLEPRSFRYMTKIDLLDARLEAPPLRYWWSRIDTRESTINTLFLVPET